MPLIFICSISTAVLPLSFAATEKPQRPNVVIVITDDQGYGDLAAHGNKLIQTPKMDRLRDESIRFTQFHVDPTCAPTRAALMTGRYATRVGVWHTVLGRSILRKKEVVMPELFAEAGYRTGLFGKWHLGDNYPYRPHDRGFHEAFYHHGGGLCQSSDYWGNDYFDDTYYRNGVPEKAVGYCTDVWFNNAIDFVKRNRDKPFFLYVATNAPHRPLHVDENYWKPYTEKGLPENLARFYGMITNIDENLDRLDRTLRELGLAENTIFIFMTDNGSGENGFNAGMRGKKGGPYDGGHRVPFFVRWPKGNFGKSRDIGTLAAHLDVLPTLIDVCGLKKPEHVELDGVSLLPLLTSAGQPENWPDRGIGLEVNREGLPRPWVRSAFLMQRWRLVEGKELYDIEADPGQKNDLAATHPEIVEEMKKRYLQRWPRVMEDAREWARISVGSPQANPVCLCVHDMVADKNPPLYQEYIEEGYASNGRWAVDVERAGKYRFRLRTYPEESKKASSVTHATLAIGDRRLEKTFDPDNPVQEVVFELELKTGPTWVETELDDRSRGIYRSAFYVYVERLE